jgi:hypothetical protein
MPRFPYTATPDGSVTLMPRLSLTLHYGAHSTNVVGLLDTGAAVNLLPYTIGRTLGAVWEAQTIPLPLTGSLGNITARALILDGTHPQLTPQGPVRLAFAWAHTDDVPLLFGQVNFFLTFAVCFYRSEGEFEIHPVEEGYR